MISDFTESHKMKKLIIKNILFRQLAIFVNIISKILILVIVGRTFGPEYFGIYSFVFVIYNFSLVISCIGLRNYIFYEFSKKSSMEFDADFNNILSIILIFNFIMIGLAFSILYISGSDREIILSSLILNLGLVFETISEIFFSLLDSKERMVESSILRIGINIFPLLFISLIIYIIRLSFIYIFISFLLSKIIIFSITIIKINKSFNYRYSIKKPDFRQGLKVFKESLPFAFNNLFTLGLNRVDILMLSAIIGNYATGIYNSSLSLILKLNSTIKPFTTAIFPQLNYNYQEMNNKFKNLFKNSTKIILTAGTLFFVITFLGAEKIVYFFWGDKYIQAIPVLRILSFMIVFKFINLLFANIITISGNQTKRTKLILYAFIFNLLMNIFLIPRYSYTGAASSALATQIFITVGLIILFIRLKVRIYFDFILIAKLISISLLFIIFNNIIPDLTFFLYIPSITIIFIAMCILLRVFEKKDFLKIVNLVKLQKQA